MPNALQNAGALSEPSNFAPLHTNRIFTGLWTNRSFLRDAATNDYQEHFGMGRQDSILDGLNTEITPRLTLARRPGSTVYNRNVIQPVKRFYSFNTFSLTDELIRVMADTATDVLDITVEQDGTAGDTSIWTKSAAAVAAKASTYFLGVGNTLYFTNGFENKQWNYGLNKVWDWGIQAPANAPTVSQVPRPNTYPPWQAETGYEVSSPAISGILILDHPINNPAGAKFIPTQTGGEVAILCGQDYQNGSSIALPPGFDSAHMMVWVSPGVGFNASALPAGVYKSYGTGGVLSSSFQNRSGGYGFDASDNWIAVAWNGAGVTSYTAANYAGITFKTVNGDDLTLQVQTGYQGSLINVPAGFSIANSLSQAGMVSCDNINHSLQIVVQCTVDSSAMIHVQYNDDSGNEWFGNAGVLTVFWKPGQGISTTAVANGTALLIPLSSPGVATLIFAAVPYSQSHGLPTGFTAAQIIGTCAMGGGVFSGGNRAHGWNCLLDGQEFVGYYMDGDGNKWSATANVFAVGSTAVTPGGNVQFANGTGTTGATEPSPWNPAIGGFTTDGSITWRNLGPSAWQAGQDYALGSVVMGVILTPPGTPDQIFVATTPGTSGPNEPRWPGAVGLQIGDGTVIWTCLGRALIWSDIGPTTPITAASTIVDPNGYLQTVYSPGVSGATQPAEWATELGALTIDGTVIWQNIGPFAVAATAPVQYGYAYMNSATDDISNMSPASAPITIMQGSQAIVQGEGSADPQVDTVVIFRTAQGGSTFLYADQIPNPGAGQTWTWTDNITDDELNPEWQAQVAGEGTPLPAAATCLGYHLGRIFAAVGNVVWISSGPDAVVGGSSGNAGFDTTFTAQSRIIRFWACPLGMIVFTVRDAYIILGSATQNDPLYMVVFIEDLPLRSYDCFTVNKTTPYLLQGNDTLVALDPSAGITEVGFPIADHLLNEFDAAKSYVTFHTQSSLDTALYVANGFDHWYRMAANNAPENGSAWSTRAVLPGGMGMGCVQSVEVAPGQYRLLISLTTPSPILQRERKVWSDNATPYPAWTRFGAIVLALPGQLAALSFITLESAKVGTRASLALLLGEASGPFEALNRTRQDPTNLPPSSTVYSDRYHFAQSQNTAWCRYFQMEISWPEEEVPNELFTFTIFGQTWQEMRAQ